MTRWIVICVCLLAWIFLINCRESGSAQKEASSTEIYNPNGDSELALLMREMFDKGMVMKTAIQEEEMVPFGFDPHAIFTAHATEPDKAASEEYRALGLAYIAAAKAMEEAAPEDRKTYFQGMVHACMACHEQLCPGPTRKIQRMFYDDL